MLCYVKWPLNDTLILIDNIFTCSQVIPWQVIKILLYLYFLKMGYRYLDALSSVYTFNFWRGMTIIIIVMAVPGFAWLLNLIINLIAAVQDMYGVSCYPVLTDL